MVHRQSAATVTLDVTAELVSIDGDRLPLAAVLSYTVSDPYAVHATFSAPSCPQVSWVFARELLTNDMPGPAGLGDVTVWRSSPEDDCDVYVGLVSPDGEALLHIPGAAIATFLEKTYAQCPPGQEHLHMDLDLEIEHLLAS
jgi:hypothetical protein